LDFKIIFDVVIIGAGAAGIAAARYLRDNTHKSYVVLEARNRIGGRVYSEKVGDKEQDFGASWIHNFSTENPFKKLVEGLDWPQIHYDVNNTEWFDLNGKYNPEIHKQASKLFQQMVKKGRSKVGSSVW
jgi:monoamine oxidase